MTMKRMCTATSAVLATIATFMVAPAASAYFNPSAYYEYEYGPYNQNYDTYQEGNVYYPNPAVVPSRYYQTNEPLYRSQRGRDNTTTQQPMRGDYDTNVDNSIYDNEALHRRNLQEFFDRIAVANEDFFYDNESYPDGELDLRALVTHSCFQPAGSEMEACRNRFGEYYDLEAAIMDGSLYSVVVTNNTDVEMDMRALYNRMVDQLQEDTTEVSDPMTLGEMIRSQRRSRRNVLWEICTNQHSTYDDAAACLMNYQRLFLDEELYNESVPALYY